MQMSEPIVDRLDEEWAAIDELCGDFTEQEWKTPTALPGWTVQDCLSHVLGTERMLLGDPAPDVDVSELAHVKDPFAAAMETWVEERRTRPGAEVLAEYREQIPRRLAQLRAMTTEQFDEPGFSPIGEVPYRDFMVVRVFDCWMHEQDIRRALDRPGHLGGPVVDTALQRFRAALGFIVGKRAQAPDGASVVFATQGGDDVVLSVVVEGRARVVDETPGDPTVRITLPLTTFVALGGGRWTAAEAEAAGGISLEGDTDLGRRVLEGMAFTP
jgi:uncharacterized protein (TIGR03083 family)